MALRTAMKASRATKKASKAVKQDPKPKFKADRKLDKEVEERLAKQDKIAKDADKAKAKGDKPKAAPKSRTGRAFEQTAAEKAADKAPKPKTDKRAARAGAFVTNAQKKAIADAPSVQALTSLQAKFDADVKKLKNATDDEKKERIDKIRALIKGRKEAIRKKAADAAKPKKADTRPARKKPQSAKERQDAAVGRSLTPRRAPANDKKPSMAMMTSYTSMERGAAIAKAGRDLRAGKITQAQHDAIVDAVNLKNEREVARSAAKRSGKKRVTLPKAPKGMEPQRGAAKGLFNKGGVVQGKPRTGHTDMRMGGIFYK